MASSRLLMEKFGGGEWALPEAVGGRSQHEHATVGDARAPGSALGERDDDARCPWGSATREWNCGTSDQTPRPAAVYSLDRVVSFYIFIYIYIKSYNAWRWSSPSRGHGL